MKVNQSTSKVKTTKSSVRRNADTIRTTKNEVNKTEAKKKEAKNEMPKKNEKTNKVFSQTDNAKNTAGSKFSKVGRVANAVAKPFKEVTKAVKKSEKKTRNENYNPVFKIAIPIMFATFSVLITMIIISPAFAMSLQAKKILEQIEIVKTYFENPMVTTAEGEYTVRTFNPDGEKYLEWSGIKGDWNVSFVLWCADECGYIDEEVIPKAPKTMSFKSWYARIGRYKPAGREPALGDLVFFKENSLERVGIVTWVNTSDKTFKVIYGGLSSKTENAIDEKSYVRKKEFSFSSEEITGYALPLYPLEETSIPKPYGTKMSYVYWEDVIYEQPLRLQAAAGITYDENGFGKIGERYVICCTSTFGEVGDYVDWELQNGATIKTVIGDIMEESLIVNEYGDDFGACVIKFMVSKDWEEKEIKSYNHDWNSSVKVATKVGNYWD